MSSAKLLTPGGGGVILKPESSIAADVEVNLPVTAGTLATTSYVNSAIGTNRIINGAMMIDQRNGGASVTPTTDGQYGSCDRWSYYLSQASKFSVQQNAGSVTPPAGFTNYLGITSLSSYSVTGNDYFAVIQKIEGFNFSDFGWGTANAQPATLSFWVRSSLTGTFGGALTNNAFNRSYPFSYSISSPNTWTQVSITIAGDTSGTWVGGTNGVGVIVQFGLGAVAGRSGTAGAWAGNWLVSSTGATSVVGTNGATFYLTGVQLEKGTQATPFQVRQYGDELALCQRYYESGDAIAYLTASNSWFSIPYKVNKRAVAVVTRTGNGGITGSTAGTTINTGSFEQFFMTNTSSNVTGGSWTASAEL